MLAIIAFILLGMWLGFWPALGITVAFVVVVAMMDA
jgi:UPF0716 family protein affecting phage T7 exclusion